MLAISSFDSWLIGGMTELKSLPLTVTLPLRPFSTMPIARSLSFARQSDFASGGNTLGRPSPLGWWQTEQVPLYCALPDAICCSLVGAPLTLACAAVATGSMLG